VQWVALSLLRSRKRRKLCFVGQKANVSQVAVRWEFRVKEKRPPRGEVCGESNNRIRRGQGRCSEKRAKAVREHGNGGIEKKMGSRKENKLRGGGTTSGFVKTPDTGGGASFKNRGKKKCEAQM